MSKRGCLFGAIYWVAGVLTYSSLYTITLDTLVIAVAKPCVLCFLFLFFCLLLEVFVLELARYP